MPKYAYFLKKKSCKIAAASGDPPPYPCWPLAFFPALSCLFSLQTLQFCWCELWTQKYFCFRAPGTLATPLVRILG